jgi:membrane protein implicated in regulation of membrane protease activity
MNGWVWWLIVAVAFAVGELLTTTMFVAPLSAGALAGMVASLTGASTMLQLVLFAAVTAAAFSVVRPIARRHRHMPARLRTGTAALVGRDALVLEEVTRDSGSVKIAGEVWTARPYDEEATLAAGTRAQVVEIRGATALVAE